MILLSIFNRGGGKFFKPYSHVFKCATGENQSVLEASWAIESRRFHLGHGTYPRLSQSSGEACAQLVIQTIPLGQADDFAIVHNRTVTSMCRGQGGENKCTLF